MTHEIRTIQVGEELVSLDPTLLEFNEANLAKFQDNLAIHYDYYGAKLAELEYLKERHEAQLEQIYSEKYAYYKEEMGATDKLAEAKVRALKEYADANEAVILKKYQVKQMQQYLKAWDRAHENAKSRGISLGKEMDKLNPVIYHKERRVDEIIRGQ